MRALDHGRTQLCDTPVSPPETHQRGGVFFVPVSASSPATRRVVGVFLPCTPGRVAPFASRVSAPPLTLDVAAAASRRRASGRRLSPRVSVTSRVPPPWPGCGLLLLLPCPRSSRQVSLAAKRCPPRPVWPPEPPAAGPPPRRSATMLKLRNLSVLRRVYVWMLVTVTRLVYGPAVVAAARRDPAGRDAGEAVPDPRRLRRINSELAFGPGEWEGSFLEAHAFDPLPSSSASSPPLSPRASPRPSPPSSPRRVGLRHRRSGGVAAGPGGKSLPGICSEQDIHEAFKRREVLAAAPAAVGTGENTGGDGGGGGDDGGGGGGTGSRPLRCTADVRGGPGFPPPMASREASVSPPPIPVLHLEDICGGLREGMDALIGDSLTQCFTSEPAEPWNFLTRSLPPGPISMRPYFAAVWLAGVWIRYCVLLPLRLATLFIGIVLFFVGFAFVSTFFPRRSKVTVAANKFLIRYLASVFVASWSGYVRFHGQRPVPDVNQIYVANHTSLIDVFLLIKDYPFACIGQRHGGLAGALQDLVNTVQNHVWFDREEGRDRAAVQRLLTAHVSTPGNEPMLVFPEGTCVNNRYCIMFKKGSFQLGATVFPVAIKYHRGFADPFWNSSAASFPRHLLDLMTSWAVVADVYYLPPEKQRPGEDAAAFASRVKELIAARAGLISVGWDGFLKRHPIAPRFREQRQRATLAALARRAQGAAAARAAAAAGRGGLPPLADVRLT